MMKLANKLETYSIIYVWPQKFAEYTEYIEVWLSFRQGN